MSKKGTIMSLSIDPDIQERMKAVAKKRNISVSKLIRDLAEKNLPVDENEEIDTVIFKIPAAAKVSADGLKQWLHIRVDAVVKALIS
jgi:antitoxin component of RelBE/YafQ-DinJ toxin-antitoxin module